MKYEELNGKKFAIVAIGEDKDGKTEAAVFTGVGRFENGHVYLDHGGEPKTFELPDEVLPRIIPTADDLKDIVEGAEYFVMMSIGPIPEGDNPEEYIKTGLKWPD